MNQALLAPFAKASPMAALGLALVGSWLLAASSWVSAPMWPVPMTAQTYAVLLIGAACGARLAAATVAAYLAQGALGLPMFAGGAAGAAHLLGPTGGFLFGFLIAAAVVGWLVERGWSRSFLMLACAMAIGHAAIFFFGVTHLSVYTGVEGAVASGFTPFLLGSVVKTLAAAATLRFAQSVLARAPDA